jgi:hypothetical protein
LGIKELLPPFLGPDLQLKDLLTGVAFACGGSGYDPLTSTFAVIIIYVYNTFFKSRSYINIEVVIFFIVSENEIVT